MLPKLCHEMKNILIFLLFFMGICAYNSQKKDSIINVSLNQLIQNPKKFHKKLIRVKGYVKFKKQGNYIIVTENDFKKNNINNSIAFMYLIENSSLMIVNKCDEKYVYLLGHYYYGKIRDSENRKLKNGIITNIEEIELIK